MTTATLGLALLAGMLSALSPCVLPLLPIVLGTAASAHRLGPVALAAGLCVSFVAIGLFVATIGFAIGLDAGVFRFVAAAIMIAIGAVLLVPRLQEQFAVAAGPAANWASGHLGTIDKGASAARSWLACCWVPCGARASVPLSVRPLCSQHKEQTWDRLL